MRVILHIAEYAAVAAVAIVILLALVGELLSLGYTGYTSERAMRIDILNQVLLKNRGYWSESDLLAAVATNSTRVVKWEVQRLLEDQLISRHWGPDPANRDGHSARYYTSHEQEMRIVELRNKLIEQEAS